MRVIAQADKSTGGFQLGHYSMSQAGLPKEASFQMSSDKLSTWPAQGCEPQSDDDDNDVANVGQGFGE